MLSPRLGTVIGGGGNDEPGLCCQKTWHGWAPMTTVVRMTQTAAASEIFYFKSRRLVRIYQLDFLLPSLIPGTVGLLYSGPLLSVLVVDEETVTARSITLSYQHFSPLA